MRRVTESGGRGEEFISPRNLISDAVPVSFFIEVLLFSFVSAE